VIGPLDFRYRLDGQQRLASMSLAGSPFRLYAHNARGQMVQRGHDDRTHRLTWDSAHRLLQVSPTALMQPFRDRRNGATPGSALGGNPPGGPAALAGLIEVRTPPPHPRPLGRESGVSYPGASPTQVDPVACGAAHRLDPKCFKGIEVAVAAVAVAHRGGRNEQRPRREGAAPPERTRSRGRGEVT